MTDPDSSHPISVAFIGLGKMGRPMAQRLLGAGFALCCHDRNRDVLSPLVHAGAVACGSVAEAVREAEIIITMLPDGRAVRDVMLGEGGAKAAQQAGVFLADMSSSAPLDTRQLGAELDALGIGMIDAPVSGGVARAVDGSLAIMVGGEVALVARARPILAAMGSRIFHAGRLGSGHAVKALNNYVSAAGLTAACEAAMVAEAFGIDPGVLVDILNASTGRNNSTEVKMKPHILSGTFASGFALGLMAKDLTTATDLARNIALPQPGMAAQSALWNAALDQLGEGADHTEIFRFLQAASERARSGIGQQT